MSWIPTLGTSISTCMGLFRIKLLLVGSHLLLLPCLPLVTGWSWLEKLFLLVLAWFEVCVLMSHQIILIWTTWGHLQLVWCYVLLPLKPPIFFASCLTLFAGIFSRSMLLSLVVLDTNSSSFKKDQKMSWCKMFAVSCGYLARHTWACTALYHSSTDLLSRWKLVSTSNLALTSFAWSLQNSSYLD